MYDRVAKLLGSRLPYPQSPAASSPLLCLYFLGMTALTRRRTDNAHQETWHIYRDDVRIGAIGMRAGVPTSADQWGWSVGFYPGTEPGMQRRQFRRGARSVRGRLARD